MKSADIPGKSKGSDTAKRVEALQELGIFSNKSNDALDSVVELVSEIFGTPAAAVTLLDDQRLVIKSLFGGNSKSDVSSSDAFCTVVVESSAPLSVPDATADTRFRSLPSVAGEPFLKSYAGAPVIVRGNVCVGTLCALDVEPRTFTSDQLSLMTRLSNVVARILEQEVNFEKLEELNESLRNSQKQERRFETIFDGLQEGIIIRNGDGKVLNANPSAAQVIGISLEELLEHTAYDPSWRLVNEDGEPLTLEDLPSFSAMRTGMVVHGMVIGIDATDKPRRWMLVRSHPFFSPEAPDEMHTSTSFTDITIEKQRQIDLINATESLRHALEIAESANKAKTAFLANMSHEIRTPLNGIVGVASVLSRTDLSTSQQEMTDLISSSGIALGRLLNDTLDLAQMEAQQLELQLAPFHLASEIQAAAELFRISATEKSLKYFVEIDPSCRRQVVGDATRIRQIISNLISNAIKFTDAGSIHIRMRYAHSSGQETPGTFNVLVSDTGIGFEKSFGAIMFNRFQQADETITRRYGGTGLGLSISQQLASEMGGTIKARTRPGHGSVFQLRIPMFEETVSSEALSDAVGDTASEERTLNILVAEDHPVNQKMMQIIFDAVGFRFDIATNGLEAIKLHKKSLYDCIILDMHMPEMDGITAVSHIRETSISPDNIHIPIIMLTADTCQNRANAALAAGANSVLHKPITAEAILRGIQMAMSDTEVAPDNR